MIEELSDLDLIAKLAIFEAQESFWAFRRYINPKMKLGWWQEECAAELQQFYADLAANLRPKLLFEGPRQHGKTRQVVEFLAWVGGKNPNLRKLYASYSDRLGKRANRDLQRILQSRRYREVFPGTRVQITPTAGPEGQPAAQKTQTILEYVGYEGGFRNTTVLGAINGEGFDLGVFDDPLKGRTESHSQVKRDTAWNWFSVDFLACMSDSAGLLIIAARRHKDDPVSRARNLYGDKLRVISYPAIATKDEKHRKEGEALFPELKSIEFLRDLKLTMPPDDWAATMQQEPRTEGGNVIEGRWFGRYSIAPILKRRVIYADTALKTEEANDFSVFLCAGLGDDGRLYVLDLIRGKWAAPELKRRARDFWRKHAALDAVKAGPLTKMRVEDKASGTGLIQELSTEPPLIPVDGIQRDRDRYTRVQDVLGYIEAGMVQLPDSAPWVSDFVAECEGYAADDSHSHDDQVDPLVDAVKDMLASNSIADMWERME